MGLISISLQLRRAVTVFRKSLPGNTLLISSQTALAVVPRGANYER